MFVTPNSLKYNESGNLGEWGESDERFPLLVESVIHRYDSVCSFSFSSSAAAEEDDSTNDYFEEVIVTAERTAKSVMDTSMTITGFSEDTLKNLASKIGTSYRFWFRVCSLEKRLTKSATERRCAASELEMLE